MKTLKLAIVTAILALGINVANAQVRVGVSFGYPAYHRVYAPAPVYYEPAPAYYAPERVYYRPAYYHRHGYYGRPVGYRRAYYRHW